MMLYMPETATTTMVTAFGWNFHEEVDLEDSEEVAEAATEAAVLGAPQPAARNSEFSLQVRLSRFLIFRSLQLRRHLGLPPSGSWQDLKDHMREAGDVCFADAFKDGSGVVEFLRYEDMKYAIKKLDDSRFRSHEVRCLSVVISTGCR